MFDKRLQENGAAVIDLATKTVIQHLDHSNELVEKCLLTQNYIITRTPAIIHIWDKTTFQLKRKVYFEHLKFDDFYLSRYHSIVVLMGSEVNNVLLIVTDETKMNKPDSDIRHLWPKDVFGYQISHK